MEFIEFINWSEKRITVKKLKALLDYSKENKNDISDLNPSHEQCESKFNIINTMLTVLKS